MSTPITGHEQHIARLDQEIAALEALRGTDQEPPALEALLAQKRRKRSWHAVRVLPKVPNTGIASLYEKGGHTQRKAGLRRTRSSDVPVSGYEDLLATPPQ